jgi:hypothetical protein
MIYKLPNIYITQIKVVIEIKKGMEQEEPNLEKTNLGDATRQKIINFRL